MTVQQELQKLANPKQAQILQRFFKTGQGEYGAGDVFLGVKVPLQRQVAKKYKDLSLPQVLKLLRSKIHEHRLTALFILVAQYRQADAPTQQKIVDFYLQNTKYINNWDLVDSSAHYIVGDYLLDKPRIILYKLARSRNLWSKRIAMMSTLAFIRHHEYNDTLRLARILLHDKHDLIHKVVGWMLREVGNRDQKVAEEFLKKYYKTMPRTMLRYAVEKFTPQKREFYLK